MLRIFGQPVTRHGKISRREVLRAGALTTGGLTLADLFRRPALAQPMAKAKHCILMLLNGGPMFTPNPSISLFVTFNNENDIDALIRFDKECNAVKLPAEMRMASTKLGLRLLKIFEPLVESNLISSYKKLLAEKECNGHYAIVFGMIAQQSNITKIETLQAFYYNAVVGFVTNSVKLIPLGQQEGQEILFSLHHNINTLAEQSMQPDASLIGLCCPGFDIRCMEHERLYSRLYMS